MCGSCILVTLAVHPDFQGYKGLGARWSKISSECVADKGALTIQLGSDDEDDMTSLAGVDLYDNLPEKIAIFRIIRIIPIAFIRSWVM